jgi:uncharacterized pyridoxamine 5'-phosphate oxidase family protein
MNILALCNQTEAIEILRTIRADKYIFINSVKVRGKHFPKNSNLTLGKNVFVYAHRALKKGRYFPKINWNKIPPLDGDLIEEMSLCEQETLKMCDRIGPISKNFEARRNYYYNNLRYFSYILLHHKIDVFYRCAPPHEGYDNVIAHLCKYYGIPAFYANPFHTNKGKLRYFARNVKNNFPDFDEKRSEIIGKYKDMEIILREELEELLNTHWDHKIPSVIPPRNPKPKIQRKLLVLHKNLIKFYNSYCIKPNLKEKYIYFPLHYQYEATTCPMGGPFVDQHLAVELLSRTGITIYVKEHPRMSKNRNLEYYKKLLRIPNVRFVSQKTDNYALIDNSVCVANITGTAGWEAIMRGKPAIIFGDIHYGYCPGAFRIRNSTDVISVFSRINEFKPNKRDIEIYLKTLEEFYLFRHNTKDIIKALKYEIEKVMEEKSMYIYSPMKSNYDEETKTFSDINLDNS